MTARLEDFAVPELLRPRLRADLFPELHPGIDQLLEMWHTDVSAASESARPVVPPHVHADDDFGGETVYITSNTFAKTFPMKVRMNIPAAAVIQQVVSFLALPTQVDIDGRLGCHFKYDLAAGTHPLEAGVTLYAQDVKPYDLLWFQVEMRPFSAVAPVSGSLEPTTFRDAKTMRRS